MGQIPLSDIESFMTSGWINTESLDLSRLIPAGQTITVIISDAPFEVPATLPGGAITLASKQHTFAQEALVKMRVLTRGA